MKIQSMTTLKKTTLISILPETTAEHVIQKYDEENSYDDMEQFVFDYLERLESRNTDQSKKKPLEQSQEKVQNLERKSTNTSGPTNTTGMMSIAMYARRLRH